MWYKEIASFSLPNYEVFINQIDSKYHVTLLINDEDEETMEFTNLPEALELFIKLIRD